MEFYVFSVDPSHEESVHLGKQQLPVYGGGRVVDYDLLVDSFEMPEEVRGQRVVVINGVCWPVQRKDNQCLVHVEGLCKEKIAVVKFRCRVWNQGPSSLMAGTFVPPPKPYSACEGPNGAPTIHVPSMPQPHSSQAPSKIPCSLLEAAEEDCDAPCMEVDEPAKRQPISRKRAMEDDMMPLFDLRRNHGGRPLGRVGDGVRPDAMARLQAASVEPAGPSTHETSVVESEMPRSKSKLSG